VQKNELLAVGEAHLQKLSMAFKGRSHPVALGGQIKDMRSFSINLSFIKLLARNLPSESEGSHQSLAATGFGSKTFTA